MHQNSLFDGEPVVPERSAIALLGVAGSARQLNKTQKRFNKLIEKLTAQRQELARWQAFRQAHQQQLAGEYFPLTARLREKRIAIAAVLDRAMESKAFGKRERAKIRDMLTQLLSDLLGEAEDPELVRLYDKYADVSFGEEQQTDLELLRAVATESFGVDLDAYDGGESPDELSAWLAEQVAASPEAPPPPRGKRGAKALAQEALREKAAEGGTRAVREVFRKLVSELHPDRESDPAEQARKTQLMQRVNQAYEAGDLLDLLEVQLSIEQINPEALAGLAKERLRHYIHVLEEQSRRLRDELSEMVAPFAMAVGHSPGKISPEMVRRELDADIRELKQLLRSVEQDCSRFQDTQQLKRRLRDYEIDPFGEDEWPIPDFGAREFQPFRGKKRGRRR